MAAPNLARVPTNTSSEEAPTVATHPPTAPPESTLTVTGKLHGIDVRATGMFGAGFLAAFGLALIMLFADPFHNPQHFVVAMMTCVVSGMFMTGAVLRGRITDALEARDAFRAEMNRMAWRNQELERIILRNRLSSDVQSTKPQSELQENSVGSASNTVAKPTKSTKQPAKIKPGK